MQALFCSEHFKLLNSVFRPTVFIRMTSRSDITAGRMNDEKRNSLQWQGFSGFFSGTGADIRVRPRGAVPRPVSGLISPDHGSGGGGGAEKSVLVNSFRVDISPDAVFFRFP
jgi:hypothetical protein